MLTAFLFLTLYAVKHVGNSGGERPPTRLAVLPLEILSGDVTQQYFADEMTDDIIAKLGQIHALRPIGRVTVMQYKNSTNSPQEIANQLKVSAVVQGKLKRDGDKLHIEARLFQSRNDRQPRSAILSTGLERDLREVFKLQNEIVLAIAAAMQVRLRAEEQRRLADAPAVNPVALGLYYQGRAKTRAFSDTNNKEAIRLCERALEIDKSFAPAWAELAGDCINQVYNFEPKISKLEDKALSSLLEAIRINPELALAYEKHGNLLWSPIRNFQHEEAINLFRHALQLNPSSIGALHWSSWVYNHTGFSDQAIAKAEEVAALDPVFDTAVLSLACSHLWKGEYHESLLLWPRAAVFLCSLTGSHWAWTLFALGQTNEAHRKIAEYLQKIPEDRPGELTAMEAVLLAAEGKEAEAVAKIRIAEEKTATNFGETHHCTYLIACAYARLNKTREGIRWLKQAADKGFPCYPLFVRDPNLANLRADAEFQAFLKAQEQDWLRRSNLWFRAEAAAK
jgi:adenylate cyclase